MGIMLAAVVLSVWGWVKGQKTLLSISPAYVYFFVWLLALHGCGDENYFRSQPVKYYPRTNARLYFICVPLETMMSPPGLSMDPPRLYP